MVDVDNSWQPTGKLTAQVYGPVCVSACLSVRHKSVLNSNNNKRQLLLCWWEHHRTVLKRQSDVSFVTVKTVISADNLRPKTRHTAPAPQPYHTAFQKCSVVSTQEK